MKWLIYFLLIFNIGFAAWHFRGLDTSEENVVDALDIHNESQLILLSELQQQQTLKKSAGGKLCYSLGPFTNKVEADNHFIRKQTKLVESIADSYNMEKTVI